VRLSHSFARKGGRAGTARERNVLGVDLYFAEEEESGEERKELRKDDLLPKKAGTACRTEKECAAVLRCGEKKKRKRPARLKMLPDCAHDHNPCYKRAFSPSCRKKNGFDI